MFDFQKWRDWLKGKSDELRDDGFVTEWKTNDNGLRGTGLSATNSSRLGQFRSFENGLVDYEVMDAVTEKWAANEAMIRVDDQNFAEVFQQFSDILKAKGEQMNEVAEGQRISLPWALICALGSLVVGVGFNETVAHGHGKAIGFGLFVTAFITKTFQKALDQSKVAALMACVAAFHIFLVFIIPNDSQYPGGLLFPAGIVEIAVFYYLFGRVAKR